MVRYGQRALDLLPVLRGQDARPAFAGYRLAEFSAFLPQMQAGRASSTRKIIKSNFCQTPGRSADRPLKKHSTLRFYFQS